MNVQGGADTAHGRFKDSYRTTLRRALILTLAIHVAAFMMSPRLRASPPRPEPPLVVIDSMEPIVPPPPDIDVEPAGPGIYPRAMGPDVEPSSDVPVPPQPSPSTLLPADPRGIPAPPVYVPYDRAPVLMAFTPPRYPPLAREAGIEGTVVVRVLVGDDGKVVDAVVLSSDVTDTMAAAAVDAARRCRFRPAKQQDRAVPAWVAVPFQFRLH
jgi:periplasmic protein TonB